MPQENDRPEIAVDWSVNGLARMAKPSHFVYNSMIKIKAPEDQTNVRIKFWINTFDNLNIHIDWEKVHTTPARCLIDSKHRSFAYRFIKKIIFSDLKLFHCHLRESTLCSLCSENIGNFLHLYWECRATQAFIHEFTMWYNNVFHTELHISKPLFLIGSYNNDHRLDIFTESILWYLKWTIHCARFNNGTLNMDLFIENVKQIERCERCYALEKDKLNLHNLKWFHFLSAYDEDRL